MSCELEPGVAKWFGNLSLLEFLQAIMMLEECRQEGMCVNCALNAVHAAYVEQKAEWQEKQERIKRHTYN